MLVDFKETISSLTKLPRCNPDGKQLLKSHLHSTQDWRLYKNFTLLLFEKIYTTSVPSNMFHQPGEQRTRFSFRKKKKKHVLIKGIFFSLSQIQLVGVLKVIPHSRFGRHSGYVQTFVPKISIQRCLFCQA